MSKESQSIQYIHLYSFLIEHFFKEMCFY